MSHRMNDDFTVLTRDRKMSGRRHVGRKVPNVTKASSNGFLYGQVQGTTSRDYNPKFVSEYRRQIQREKELRELKAIRKQHSGQKYATAVNRQKRRHQRVHQRAEIVNQSEMSNFDKIRENFNQIWEEVASKGKHHISNEKSKSQWKRGKSSSRPGQKSSFKGKSKSRPGSNANVKKTRENSFNTGDTSGTSSTNPPKSKFTTNVR